MVKIEFQSGSRVSSAKVTIDGQDYIVTPAQYQGATPLSPQILNDLQDNIEAAINERALTSSLANVATSGSYNDLQDKPELDTEVELAIDNTTYVLTATLKNADGDEISSSSIDLPLESMVVNATYDKVTKELVLTLQSGGVLRISLADIIRGLVNQTDFDALAQRVTAAEETLDNTLQIKSTREVQIND